MKTEIARQFFVKFSNIKFDQNWFIRSRVVSCVQTDGGSDFNKHSAVFTTRLGNTTTTNHLNMGIEPTFKMYQDHSLPKKRVMSSFLKNCRHITPELVSSDCGLSIQNSLALEIFNSQSKYQR
jgi:hypothetical protein